MADSRNDNNYDSVSGLCYYCKTLCTNKCSRCGEFYCSLQCQRSDWKNHRYVCFKMPYLMMGPSLPNESTDNTKHGSTPHLHNGFHKINEKLNNGNRSLGGNLSSTSSTSSLTMRNQPEPKKIDFGHMPKNNEDVVLLWVSENSYYIRTCRSSSDYENNQKAFHQYGLNANKLQHVPEKNDIVLVRWDQHFVRGLVLNSSNNENIHVALFDIGGTTHKPLSYLREISDELSERKRFNFKIGLDIGSIKAKECQKLLSFVREKTVFRLEFDGDTFAPGINVKLFEKVSGSSLDKLLRSPSTYAVVQETTEPEPSQKTRKHETKEPLKSTSSQQVTKHTTSAQLQPKESVKLTASVEPQKHLKNEERQEPSEVTPNPKLTTTTKTFVTDLTLETLPENVADILVLDTSTIGVGCISVIELKNADKLNSLQARIKNDIVKDLSEEYDPENNEVCLAKFADDGEWYRAEYIAEYDQFGFIDYGNYASVERKDVRKLPLSLTDPCYTVSCNIDNFETLSVEGRGKLSKFLSENPTQKGCMTRKVRDEEDDEEKVYLTLPYKF